MQRKHWLLLLKIVVIALGLGITIFVLVYVFRRTSSNTCDDIRPPYFLSIQKTNEGVLVSWYVLDSEQECNTSYKMQYAIDYGKYEDVDGITETSYILPSLNACSSLSVRVWAVNEAGIQSTNYVMERYQEIPSRDAAVSNITVTSTNEGLDVRWIRSTVLDTCNVYYFIDIYSDITDHNITCSTGSAVENITISHDTYCFHAIILITPYLSDFYVELPIALEVYISEEIVEDILVTPSSEDSSEMIVAWTAHFKHDLCPLTYEVVYSSSIGDEQKKSTEDLTITFPADYCSEFIITITANTTLSTSRPATAVQTLYPVQIDGVKDLDLTQKDDKQIIVWTPAQITENCKTDYELHFTTDLGISSFITDDISFVVPEEIYCLSLKFEVQARVGEYASDLVQSTIYTYDLEEPEELILTALVTENLLHASWKAHDKQDICDIEYKVSYEYGEFSNSSTVRDTEIYFGIAYCTDATIQVRAVKNDHESNVTIGIHEREEPTSLGPVQDLIVVIDGNEARISWNPPEYAILCADLDYIVNAKNEETIVESSCTGQARCSVVMDNFCPQTNFTVIEISGITQESVVIHTC